MKNKQLLLERSSMSVYQTLTLMLQLAMLIIVIFKK